MWARKRVFKKKIFIQISSLGLFSNFIMDKQYNSNSKISKLKKLKTNNYKTI